MKLRRAVVTGGAGFLGSHLCERLIQEGVEVVCLDDLSSGSLENLKLCEVSGRLHVQQADISNGCAVKGPVDAVLHFASPASPVDYLRMPVHTMRTGSMGTFHALNLAKMSGARFLLASTSETYGNPQVHPQTEAYWGNVNPVGPRAVYDEAKRFAEALTVTYRRTYGVNAAIVRIFNTFGPRMRKEDGRAIPTFIGQALSGQNITIAGDGSQTRSFCYVDDLLDGVVRMLHSDHPGPVNLGNPEEVSVRQIAERIRKLTGSRSLFEFAPRPEDDPELRCPDITMARKLLGWTPQVSLDEGLKLTIDWFQEQLLTA
ncbi:SDR family oxidoreductase [Streptomyces sp. B21-105]|uniref:UDP-glucuronic acid decarboxylase family protein n=1 Tax=Streptomyces sp. B21-105 TaxID=3039417 RepID=UPI002FF3D147